MVAIRTNNVYYHFVIVTSAVFLHVYMNKFPPGGRLTIRVRKVYNVMVKRKLRRK